jgi:hypothetical protein
MPLGRIDFSSAPSFEPLPSGEYTGQTGSWEAKPTNNGDSTNIEAKFILNYQDDNGSDRTRTVLARWNLKPTALWRIKRDLIAMGADPSTFESADVDIESILNDLFGPIPTPVIVTLDQRSYTPEGGEARISNNVTKVVKAA